MKATGIIRRIDELGRIVIPKEIRRTCRLQEGDPMEIFTDMDGGIIFKKYYPEEDYLNEVNRMINELTNEFDLQNKNEIVSKLQEVCELLKPKEN